MARNLTNQKLPFRLKQGLIITPVQDSGADPEKYLIKEPVSGEIFEFGKEEFFLLQRIDSNTSLDEIIQAFNVQFGLSISLDFLKKFIHQVRGYGLLESDNIPLENNLPSHEKVTTNLSISDIELSSDRSSMDTTLLSSSMVNSPISLSNLVVEDPSLIIDAEDNRSRWHLCNPTPFLRVINLLFSPFRPFMRGLIWLLIPAAIAAIVIFLKYQDLMQQDLLLFKAPQTYISSLLFHLVTINLVNCLVIGAACAHYGGRVESFGIRLMFGLIPRFFIDTRSISDFNRRARLWAYGTTLLFRIMLCVAGVGLWFGSRSSGTQLSVWSISFAQAGFLSFIIVCIPVRESFGYKWFTTYTNLPPSLIKQALYVFGSTLKRQPLPTFIAPKERLKLWLYALFILIVWGFFAIKVITSISTGLASSLPSIFGRATFFVFLVLIGILLVRWLWSKGMKVRLRRQAISPVGDLQTDDLSTDYGMQWGRNRSSNSVWSKRLKKTMTTLIVGLIVFFLISPYPYKPGGQIQILPPTQQLVQAPVSGQITVVYFNGGDGQWLKAGTVLASMTSIELQNDIATLQEQVRDQQAQVEKHQAELGKLKTGPRAEEIDVAQRQIAVAGQEIQEAQKQVEVAQANIDIVQKELEAAEVQLRFSERSVARLDVLHAQGGFALQEIEAAQVINETNRVQVLEAQEQLNQAQKQVESALQGLAIKQRYFESAQAQMVLLRSGASPEDIQAASQEVVSAQAQLNALKQNFNHVRNKLKSTNLFMPLDGYLVEGYLKKKQGSFLNQGDTFTTAQDDRVAIAELHLPEYDSGELAVNSAAQVKLLAYPNTPINGSVITIEPTTTEELYGRILKVLIRLDNVNQTLKPGMTGYAKISAGEKPLIVLLTRPIVRFIQIEFWSWLP